MEREPEPTGQPKPHKVFGIGLARTGTTSLHLAMLELGLRSAPDSIPLLDGIDHDFLASYDAFFDNPIPFRYRQLDQVCPASRWIITYRSLDGWLGSMEHLFGAGLARLDPQMRVLGDRVHRELYGFDRFDTTRLAAIHEQHYRDVADWIQDRPCIWLDVDQGLGWGPICDLLGLPEPRRAFPQANRRARFRP